MHLGHLALLPMALGSLARSLVQRPDFLYLHRCMAYFKLSGIQGLSDLASVLPRAHVVFRMVEAKQSTRHTGVPAQALKVGPELLHGLLLPPVARDALGLWLAVAVQAAERKAPDERRLAALRQDLCKRVGAGRKAHGPWPLAIHASVLAGLSAEKSHPCSEAAHHVRLQISVDVAELAAAVQHPPGALGPHRHDHDTRHRR
mmetsp:Transcript_108364/g.305568  ORF Transcript_108364/g.305568 Transcript_108364/m.305568 type:complete len:202 (-) Transcript_108364:434-1039(-)